MECSRCIPSIPNLDNGIRRIIDKWYRLAQILLYQFAEGLGLFTMEVVAEFLNQTIVYLDSLYWIERYAWFGYFVSSIHELHEYVYWLTHLQSSSSVNGLMYITVSYYHKMPRFLKLFWIKIFFVTTAAWINWEKCIQVPRRYILKLLLRALQVLTRPSMVLIVLRKPQPQLGQRWRVRHYS